MNHSDKITITHRLNETQLTCEKEGWSMTANTHYLPDLEEKEVAEICIRRNEFVWDGTIQDFMAIKTYAKNALNRIVSVEHELSCSLFEEERKELEELLSHFK